MTTEREVELLREIADLRAALRKIWRSSAPRSMWYAEIAKTALDIPSASNTAVTQTPENSAKNTKMPEGAGEEN